jgi:hypothetical protein
MAVTDKPSGVKSTKETWSMAIKYVAERKRIEEALGFILEVSRLTKDGTELAGIVAALRKRVVPYLADLASFDLAPGLPSAVEVSAVAQLAPTTVERLRAIAAAVASDGAAELHNEIDLRREPSEPRIKAQGAVLRVPVTARGTHFGFATFVKCTDDVPKYSKAHLAMAVEVGRNLAVSILLGDHEARPQ